MGTTTTSTGAAAMQRSMDYIATHSSLLAGAYNVSAWTDEVKIQGERMDVIELVHTLGLKYHDQNLTDTGVVIATYTGRDGDVVLNLAVCYRPVDGLCDSCDLVATGPHPRQDHYLTPQQAAFNDRESFKAVSA